MPWSSSGIIGGSCGGETHLTYKQQSIALTVNSSALDSRKTLRCSGCHWQLIKLPNAQLVWNAKLADPINGPETKLLPFLLSTCNCLQIFVIFVRQWDYYPLNRYLQFNSISPKLKRGCVKVTVVAMFAAWGRALFSQPGTAYGRLKSNDAQQWINRWWNPTAVLNLIAGMPSGCRARFSTQVMGKS